ncbi:uncharacterized protein FIBRA_01380 [Fibroporia radiculosa]|uniref:Uncharacterized protein n=1 Tax=Fibroporia radiculosa TaxID=599839 RepID=J4HT86_9APHY|nr:uncharacterized protein FIBRA_01380 [Fibroporia radiculosa]CCL99362.1 predicted protein [Fibroporia radiculosa]
MFPPFEDEGRDEYPFPPMDAVEPSSSSSDTLPSAPSRSRSTQSRSQRSTQSPAPRQSRPHAAHDREHLSGRAKLLSRLISREERDAQHLRGVLLTATERLEGETRRADEAERRAIEALTRLRQTRDAMQLAQADAARANEEVRLYKLRLEEAQREILRAQDIVNQLERDKVDAEAEAARARSLARRYREERLITKAREEGRREGFQEGLSRGKDMGYYEARRVAQREEPRGYPRRPVMVEEFPEEEDEQERGQDEEVDDDESGSQPEVIVPIPRSPPQGSWRPPSRLTDSRATQRSPPRVQVNNTSTTESTIAAPSPRHPSSRPPRATPEPIPVPDPGLSRSRADISAGPVPSYSTVTSASHPPVDIPPDNWIPYMDRGNTILMPPPHELSRPVSPSSPSLSTNPTLPVQQQRASSGQSGQSVRARDYAYAAGFIPAQGVPATRSHLDAPFSPQSRTSTNISISQYDLVSTRTGRVAGGLRSAADALNGLRQVISTPGSSRAGKQRSGTPQQEPPPAQKQGQRMEREDRRVMSPRGPRPREDLPVDSSSESAPSRPTTARRQSSGTGSSFERLFKKRYQKRKSGSSGGVPDITVESPSNTTGSRGSTAVTQPHLLSPEFSHQPLPGAGPEDMGAEGDQRTLPPLPEFDFRTPDVVPLPDGQLPAGFVQLTPVMQVAPAGRDPVEVYDHGAMRATPKPAANPKFSPTYEMAPIPPGVVYPDPPRRSMTPHEAVGVPLPPSPPRTTSPRGRGGSLSGHLSPLSLNLFSPLRL